MKKIAILLAFVAISAASLSVVAQEKEAAADAVVTNGFWSNWFVQGNAGANISMDNFRSDLTLGFGLDIDLMVGKWIDPNFGVRAGWQGLNGKLNDNKFKYNYLHGDFMWNISNQFWGYKEDRIYNGIPYITAGFLFGNGREFGEGAGWLNNFRLNEHWIANIDLRALATHGEQINGSGIAIMTSASAGIAYNFGKQGTGWSKVSEVAPAVAAAAAAAAAAEKAANGPTEEEKAAAEQAAAEQAAAEQAAAEQAAAEKAAQEAAINDAKAQACEDLIAQMVENCPPTFFFEIGQSELSAKEKENVRFFGKNIVAGSNLKFVIVGSADSNTGTEKRNQQLSEARANCVRDILVNEYGVDEGRLEVATEFMSNSNDELNRAAYLKIAK